MNAATPAQSEFPQTDALRLAAFDFDGTLARRDTLMGFLARASNPVRLAAALASQAPSVARNRSDRDGPKAAVIRRLLAGQPAERLESLGRDYAADIRRLLRPEMVAKVSWHRSEGHRLVIVSASLRYYLIPLAEALDIDHVIAVDMEVDDNGILTGELAAPNVRGPEKAHRLRNWLGDQTPAEMWAYGDSSGDIELLAMADHPTWVGRGARKHRA